MAPDRVTPDRAATADWYDRATRDLAGHSALHVAWASGVRDDPEVLAVIDRLPRQRRQPSLVFSVATYLGAPVAAYPEFREWLLAHADTLVAETAHRLTQTNEVGRCAPLVAALAGIEGPVALLEVGASAGLCLLADRYRYRFCTNDGAVAHLDPAIHSRRDPAHADRTAAGDPAHADRTAAGIAAVSPLLSCRVTGDGPEFSGLLPSGLLPSGLPSALPEIVWRRGLEIAPLDVTDPADAAWLRALVPADRVDRRILLEAALDTARRQPPAIVRGDALRDLARAAMDVPSYATLVVVSLGTLVYLPPAHRAAFPDAVRALGARLVALEGREVLPRVSERRAGMDCPEPTTFVLSLDEVPLADVAPHGDTLSWLSPEGPSSRSASSGRRPAERSGGT